MRKSTRLGLRTLIEFLHRTAFVFVMVIPVVAGIGLIVGAMSLTGAAHSMARVLVDMAGGNLYLLLLLGAFVSIIMGMGMTSVAVYVVLAIILAPALIAMGVTPMAAHLFVIYFAMVSFITPPVCCAAYQAAALARSQPLKTGLLSSRLGVALYLIPFLYVLQPGMVLQGELTFMTVAVPILAAIVGIAFISWGAERFMPVVGDIPRWTGIVLMVGGGLIAWPGVVTRIIGAILVGLILVSLTVAPKWLQASGAR